MDLSKHFSPGAVLLDCEAADKFALITRMAEAALRGPAGASNPGWGAEALAAALIERERQQPTVIGKGVACPHARVAGFHGLAFAMARLRSPIDFGVPAQGPVRLVFLFAVAGERPPVALKLFANIARLLGDSESLSRLLGEPSAEVLCELLRERIANIDAPLTAKDIMRAPFVFLTPDTPVPEVIHRMVEFNVDAMGIVTPEGGVAGEITCDRLFTLGMPDFFSQLKSVSFIKEFDPFDKYFDTEAKQTAGDVMSTEAAVVDENATLLEVIFLLAVRRHAKVYVEGGGKLIGVIDRSRVLNEIMNI